MHNLIKNQVVRARLALGVALILTVAFGVMPHEADAATSTARALALKLTVSKENGAGYVRSAFKMWTDDDRDGCDTRKEVLLAESKVKPKLGTDCRVISGSWKSWYDNKTWTNPADVDIDHVVALKEAWDSGARTWTKINRTRYANDLTFTWSLDAITDNINSSKGARDPAEWLPPVATTHCAYATHWVAIKYRWRLTVDTTEQKKLLAILTDTCGSKPLTVPTGAL